MNITELKELAEKAVAGQWELETYDEKLGWVISNQSIFADCAYVTSEDTARFIAAANPAEILELIAKLEAAEQTARYESDLCQQALDSRKEIEGQLEDAQGEIRALRVTEAGLREKADRWDFLAPRMLAADFDYLGDGVQALVFEMPNGFSASADAADTIDRARALLEKKE